MQSASRRLAKYREQAQEATKTAVGCVVMGASAYGGAYFTTGEWEKYKYLGNSNVPTLAVGAIGGIVAGMAGLGGDQSTYLTDAGKGMGAAFLALQAAGHYDDK